MIQTLNTVVFEFVEMAIAYPNLPLNTISRISCTLILSSYLIQFSCPKLLLLSPTIGEKIVLYNLEESCYVVKKREQTLPALYLTFYRAIPPPGNVYGARIEMRVGGRAF